jgi:hypothetical protein
VCEFGFVGDVNAITETKGNGNWRVLDKRFILHSI